MVSIGERSWDKFELLRPLSRLLWRDCPLVVSNFIDVFVLVPELEGYGVLPWVPRKLSKSGLICLVERNGEVLGDLSVDVPDLLPLIFMGI
jgi:hypothetical protein